MTAFDCEPAREPTREPTDPAAPRLPKRPRLTDREHEVLQRIADGASDRQIAAALDIRPSTARTHADSVLTKLGARSRREAAAAAVPIPGIAPLPPEVEIISSLTRREREVLRRLADGMPRSDLAYQLCVTPNTLRTHVRNILAKLGVRSTLEAVALLRRVTEQVSAPRPNARPAPRSRVPGPSRDPPA